MSALANVRIALETQLASTLGSFAIAYENRQYNPVPGTPYAAPTLMPAVPQNPEMGPGYIENGIFQVSLFYPVNAGSGAAQATAESIRSAFSFGSAPTANGTTVNIISTPEIGVARAEDDFFMLPVRIRWRAFIGG